MSQPFTVVVPDPISDETLISINLPENDHAEYSPSVSYSLGARVILKTGYHKIYQSAVANNIGKFPAISPLEWDEVGPTNAWAAFDESGGTATLAENVLEFQVSGDLIDSFGFLELAADQVRIRGSHPTVGTYFDQTYTVQERTIIGSWYDYFFSQINRQSQLVVFDVPPMSDSTYTITLTSGGTIKLGTFVMGKAREFGFSQYGATVSIVNYGRTVTDQFGRRTRVRRGFAKRMTVQVELTPAVTDAVFNQLADLREVFALWVASNGTFDMLTIAGDYKDFAVNIEYFSRNLCSLEIEGVA